MQPAITLPHLKVLRPVEVTDLIRVGRDHDGGYVLPRSAVAECDFLLSLGINDDWSFERGMLRLNPRMQLLCVDGSSSFARMLKKAAQKCVDAVGYLLTLQFRKAGKNISYIPRPLAFLLFFSRHRLVRRMAGSVVSQDTVAVSTLLDDAIGTKIGRRVAMKVDIEGAEYEVLPAIISRMRHLALLIIEFHDLDRNWESLLDLLTAVSGEMSVVHVHGNNFQDYVAGTGVPRALEVTFVSTSLVLPVSVCSQRTFPLEGLDMPNDWKRPELALDFD